MKRPVSFYILLAAFVSGLGGFLLGYNTAVISGAILFIKKDFSLTAAETEWIVSSLLFGALAGAYFSGRLTDFFGREKSLYLLTAIFILGTLVTTFATDKAVLILGRALLGIGVGAASIIVPLYISEIAPPKIRGALVSLNQVMLTIGILVAYSINLAYAHEGSWRPMFGLALIPTLVMGIGSLFLPESPRWLWKKGAKEKARVICAKLYSPEEAEREIEELEKSTNHQNKHPHLWQKPYLKPVLIGLGMGIFQQIVGINVVIYYASTIFKMTGLGSDKGAILATVGLGFVNFVVTTVALRFVDKFGRRPLLLYGLVGMIVALFLLGLSFILGISGALIWVTVASLVLYIAAFAIGFGPVFWVVVAEIYPFSIRGKAMSYALLANWLANLAVVLTFLSLTRAWGTASTFWLYALFSILAWLFVYLFVPETKGKTLEEIEKIWKKG